MKDFSNSLLYAKELVRRCKNREELKRYLVVLSSIGIG